MNERISVIVPAYNIEQELARCLDSIAAQTYENIEIVVVDDGSKDGTGAVIDAYAAKDSRIKAIHKENGGVTSARLRGVAEASGQWIGFVDGDDYIEPDMYERLLQNAHTYGAQISHCGYKMRFEDGRIHYFYNTGRLVQQDKLTGLKDLIAGEFVEPGLCNKLFRKQLLHSLLQDGVMPEDIKINEDLLMNYYLFKAAESAVYQDICPYHYVVRKVSASRTKLNEHRIYDPIRVKEIIRQDSVADVCNDAQKAYINTCINVFDLLICEKAEYRKDKLAVRNLIKKEKQQFSLLNRKRRIMAWVIVLAPMVYKPIYILYKNCFQKNNYE